MADHSKPPPAEEIDRQNGTGRTNNQNHGQADTSDKISILREGHVDLTPEDNKRIKRKTDKVILAILVWVYFLQILDKSVLGYGAVFGLQEDAHLTGNQYSLIGSIAPIAQLAWQPFSAYLIVRVPHRILMPALCLGWGIAQTAMAAALNFPSLIAARFFLGLFEAGCLPLFSVITSQWYRRAEQPVRVAAWYGTNGLATIIAAALSYGLGHIKSGTLHEWQILFLFVGLVTVVTAPFVYWKLDNDIPSARFLTEHEKEQAIERLRANQTGVGSQVFRWGQVLELALEPKTYIFLGLSILISVGAAVTNAFGPLVISGLGYDKYITSLLNIPFGAVQLIVILLGSWAAYQVRYKSVILVAFSLPVIAGLAILYVVPRDDPSKQGALLAGYYLLAFLFAAVPLIASWIISNTAGATKKSVMMSLYNAGVAAGNIVGPLLFTKDDAPEYLPGLRKVLGIQVAFAALVGIQAGNLFFLNKMQERKRVAKGKPAKLKDTSMTKTFRSPAADIEEINGELLGESALLDLTDGKNEDFVYVY